MNKLCNYKSNSTDRTMFENCFEIPKALTRQEIKVMCIKDDDVYDTFQAGKEYEATYDPPFILSPRSSFYVNSGKSICGWLWEDFHEYFKVLTEGFEGTSKILLEYGKD